MDRLPAGTVFIVPGFPADERDTSCLPAVQNYVAAYAAATPGRSVHVLALHYPFDRHRYRWKGVTVHALGGRNRRGVFFRALRWTDALWVLFRLSRKVDVRVIHSFWLGEGALLGQWAARGLRARHIASIGGRETQAANRYLGRLALDRMVVTAGSAFAAETYRLATGRDVDAVVPIGLDAAFVQYGGGGERYDFGRANRYEPELGPSAVPVGSAGERNIHVLGVGSLIPLKRFDVFVEVVERLVRTRPALRAAVIGDGPLRAALQAKIDAAGLQECIRLLGPRDRGEVAQFMRRSRVFLHPSIYESQGYVFLEALASGCFVVCRDVGFTAGHPAAMSCRSDEEMIEAVASALDSRCPPDGRVPSIEETVRQFYAIYGTAGTFFKTRAVRRACRRRDRLQGG